MRNYFLPIIILKLLIVGILLCSCNPSINRIGYVAPSDNYIDSCDVPIIKDSSLIFDDNLIIGTIELGDPGFAINCGAEEITKIVQSEACKVEADFINIIELNPPDFWSSCYRLRAELIKLKENQFLAQELINKHSYQIGEAEKYFDGILIDSLDVPKPDFRLSIGSELNRAWSLSLNLYMYVYGFGFSYSYGFPSSTRDPNKQIRDIEDSHHLKITFDVMSLQSGMAYYPIYIGIGKSYLNEKAMVQGFEGNGKIQATHYFIGFRFLSDRRSFFNTIGTYIELGYSNWNYNDSILANNNSDLKYNYPSFYFNLGICLYLY